MVSQNVAVIRGNLPTTQGLWTDFTSPGFGAVDAAIIVLTNANTSNNPQNDAILSVGFFDGTNQSCAAAASTDNVSTSDETRRSVDNRAAVIVRDTRTFAEYTATAITDGIRLTGSFVNTGLSRHCTVFLISNANSSVFTLTPNATQNASVVSPSLGFAPDLALFVTCGNSTNTLQSQSFLTFGLAEKGGLHRIWGQGHRDSRSITTENTMWFSESRCTGECQQGTITWSGEVTNWGADDFTLTTRDGGSGGDYVFVLALGGVSYDLGTLTTPGTAGNVVIPTAIAPDSIFGVLSTCPGAQVYNDDNAEGVSVGMSDTSSYSHGTTVGEGLNTSNTRSISSASLFLDLDDEQSGFNNLADATVDSFNADNVTLNYSRVPAVPRKGWYLTFGTSAAPPTPITGQSDVAYGASGNLTPRVEIAGQSDVAYGASANLTEKQPGLSGQSDVAYGANAAIASTVAISSQSDVVYGTSAEALAIAPITGQSDVAYGASGSLTPRVRISGQSNVAYDASAELTQRVSLTAQSGVVYRVSGDILLPGQIVGRSHLVYDADGTLSATVAISGLSALEYTASGRHILDFSLTALSQIIYGASGRHGGSQVVPTITYRLVAQKREHELIAQRQEPYKLRTE